MGDVGAIWRERARAEGVLLGRVRTSLTEPAASSGRTVASLDEDGNSSAWIGGSSEGWPASAIAAMISANACTGSHGTR